MQRRWNSPDAAVISQSLLVRGYSHFKGRELVGERIHISFFDTETDLVDMVRQAPKALAVSNDHGTAVQVQAPSARNREVVSPPRFHGRSSRDFPGSAMPHRRDEGVADVCCWRAPQYILHRSPVSTNAELEHMGMLTYVRKQPCDKARPCQEGFEKSSAPMFPFCTEVQLDDRSRGVEQVTQYLSTAYYVVKAS